MAPMADVAWVLTSKELKERQGETQRYKSETRRPIRSPQAWSSQGRGWMAHYKWREGRRFEV